MRARNIKPALFKNEILGAEDPILTIVFCGLWCAADREGRIEDRPLRLKAEILPYREGIDFNGYLTELERLRFIDRYQVGNVKVISVINFDKHQNPHKTERGSNLPDKTDGCPITVKDPLTNGSRPADSLIPDSLIPDSNPPLSPKGEKEGQDKKSGLSKISNAWLKAINRTVLNSKQLEALKELFFLYGEEKVLEAIEVTAENGANMNYLKAVCSGEKKQKTGGVDMSIQIAPVEPESGEVESF